MLPSLFFFSNFPSFLNPIFSYNFMALLLNEATVNLNFFAKNLYDAKIMKNST